MALSLQGYSFRTFNSWVASHMARTSTIYVHHRILTHHECGCKICCWARRAQNPPGWRASLSELPPEVGAGRPPSWKTRTLICVTKTMTGPAGLFIQTPSGVLEHNSSSLISFISSLLINTFIKVPLESLLEKKIKQPKKRKKKKKRVKLNPKERESSDQQYF